MLSTELSLPPDAASVSAARRFLSDALRSWDAPDLAWAGAQLVSELATNAVLHARTDFRVRLELNEGVLRIAVRDASEVGPSQRHYAQSATTGRGLNLLEALSRSWGTEPTEGGKWVWCEVVAEEQSAHPHPDVNDRLSSLPDPPEGRPADEDDQPQAALRSLVAA